MCTIYDVLSHLMLFCCRGRGLLSFVAIYALLRGEKFSQKLGLWRKLLISGMQCTALA